MFDEFDEDVTFKQPRTFALFELATLPWGTYVLKWKVIYLNCKEGFNQTLSMHV